MSRSSPPRVVVTCPLPREIRTSLRERFDCVEIPLGSAPPLPFARAAEGARALLVAPGDRVDAPLVEALPASVELVVSYSTGLDHVDADGAARRGIAVAGTPDVLTDATADVALLLILATVRGSRPAEQLLGAGGWTGWAPDQVFGRDLRGLRLGLVGGGRIAAAVAGRVLPLGLRATYWARGARTAMEAAGAQLEPALPALLGRSDVVSLHVPSTKQTRGLISAEALAAMPHGAVLVNTARGDLLDDEAVLEALATGRLAAVGLDVFAGEPHLHPGYAAHPRSVLLPHIGSATDETRRAMGALVVAALERHLTP